MYINIDNPGIVPVTGWSGGDGVEHALERIKKLVNKCVARGEMLIRDGEGYLSPTALQTEAEQNKIRNIVLKLTRDKDGDRPEFDKNGKPQPGPWFNEYDNVSRAMRNVLHVAICGNMDLSILDMEKDLARTFVRSLKKTRSMIYDNWFHDREIEAAKRAAQLAHERYISSPSNYWEEPPEEEPEFNFHRITEEEYYDYLLEQDSKRIKEEVYNGKRNESKKVPWYKDPDQRDRSYEYNPDWWKKHVDNLPF